MRTGSVCARHPNLDTACATREEGYLRTIRREARRRFGAIAIESQRFAAGGWLDPNLRSIPVAIAVNVADHIRNSPSIRGDLGIVDGAQIHQCIDGPRVRTG